MLKALLAKLQDADKSAALQQTALSFLYGYGSAIAFMLLPATMDFTAFMKSLFQPQWWLTFFGMGMTGAISFTWGQKLKSIFDKPTSVTTFSSLPPKS